MTQRNRHPPETYAALRVEAQRRVRSGERASHVARDMEVATCTFQNWAAEDGFRKIDLEHEAITGERAPRPAYVAKNQSRGKVGRGVLPGDYVHRVESARTAVARRAAELKAGRSADAGEAGRLAAGEAVRLYEVGDLAGAERSARLAERFLRMAERMAGGGAKAPRGRFPVEADPVPDRATLFREIIDIRDRLERRQAEREAAREPDWEAYGGEAGGEAEGSI